MCAYIFVDFHIHISIYEYLAYLFTIMSNNNLYPFMFLFSFIECTQSEYSDRRKRQDLTLRDVTADRQTVFGIVRRYL